jgi:hypothetical protein
MEWTAHGRTLTRPLSGPAALFFGRQGVIAMKNMVVASVSFVGSLLLSVPFLGSAAWGQAVPQAETFTWLAPLERAADALQQRYGRPITYEDPIWRWAGDYNVLGAGRSGNQVMVPKTHTLVMPGGLTPATTPTLGVAELTRVLDAYRAQNPERARFHVVESGMWLQIIPAEARDEAGAFEPAGSLLDTLISVPAASRTPSEHLIALCQTITSANPEHLTVQPNTDPTVGSPFDREFAANGYMLRGPLRMVGEPDNDDDERPYILTEWGTAAVTARGALMDLMTRAGTTLTWRLKCEPAGSTCYLNVQPLMVQAPRGGLRVQVLDRCQNCRPVPVRHDLPPR